MSMHCCGQCHYLTRTSPTQVFLLCRFWAAPTFPVKGAASVVGKDYAVFHSHMQPEAPACPFFKPKEVSSGADVVPKPLLDAC